MSPHIFLSYSSHDNLLADELQLALENRKQRVFRDSQSIVGGTKWRDEIEKNVRNARAVVVLITKNAAASQWVAFEYALAIGARVPILPILQGPKSLIPSPLSSIQVIKHRSGEASATSILKSLKVQSREMAVTRSASPRLIAKFQEINGKLVRLSKSKIPAYGLELWVESAPFGTKKVAFEIPDEGIEDNQWDQTLDTEAPRQFLTDNMNSYGDLEIWARGIITKNKTWTITCNLYEALLNFYRDKKINVETKMALKQIRTN